MTKLYNFDGNIKSKLIWWTYRREVIVAKNVLKNNFSQILRVFENNFDNSETWAAWAEQTPRRPCGYFYFMRIDGVFHLNKKVGMCVARSFEKEFK